MKLLVQHLNSYFTNNYTADELVAAIEKSGVEVEDVQSAEPLNTKIVVGLTKKVVQHPNADKLRLVLVDVGSNEMLHIVCGAPNVEEDLKVAVATVGSVLPDGTEIRQTKLRGELSQGMLCSEAELGISDEHYGIMVLPVDYLIGKSLCDIAPVEVIVDTKSAANRSDLQSYEGIAREIAAQLGTKLTLPKADLKVVGNPKLLKRSDKKVAAFSATHLDVTGIGTAPAQVTQVLKAAGIRTISPVVDVTNFINLAVGQPLHAFDAGKISLPLYIRAAERGERITTLNGKTNTLTPEDLVVADSNGPIDIAGVMGGADTEVDAATKQIVLIASTIDAMTIRKTSQRHGIRTDASARYERGLPVELLDRGRALSTNMLVDMGAKVVSGARLGSVESEKVSIEVKPNAICRLLGVEVPAKVMVKHLEALEFEVSGLAKLRVRVPWWRPDVANSSDVAEEVIKMVGLDALPATIPAWSPENIVFDTTRAMTGAVRELMRAVGLFELTTYSFISEEQLQKFGLKPAKHLKLKNPLSIEQAYLRSTLLPSLFKVIEANQRYAKNFGVSEISRVFEPAHKKGDLPVESYKLGVAVMGDYFAAKAALDLLSRDLRLDLQYTPSKLPYYYPGRQAQIELNGAVIGSIGELHPRVTKSVKGNRAVSFAELDVDSISLAAHSHVFEPISRFPSISRDVAIVVKNSLLWGDVYTAIIKEHAGSKVSFQSRYEGTGIPEGHVSLAFRLTMDSKQRTLTDPEAEAVVAAVISLLKKKFGATPRS